MQNIECCIKLMQNIFLNNSGLRGSKGAPGDYGFDGQPGLQGEQGARCVKVPN